MRVIKLSHDDEEMTTRDDVLHFFQKELPSKHRRGEFGLTEAKGQMQNFGAGTLLLFTYKTECMWIGRAKSGILRYRGKPYFVVDTSSLMPVSGSLYDFQNALGQRGLSDKNLAQARQWPELDGKCEEFAIDYFRYSPGVRQVMEGADSVEGGDWSADEVDAAVKGYIRMLNAENAGKDYNKAALNRELRAGPLARRSKGSVEFRMANISAVLRDNGSPWVKGYQPRKNVGLRVAGVILKALQEHGLSVTGDLEPEDDDKKLKEKTRRARKQISSTPPKGVSEPESVPASGTTFKRDPKVRAWVIENAKGECELCRVPAPFEDDAGDPFLEVHHVVRLCDKGADTHTNAVAVCPNCHRRLHEGKDRVECMERLYASIPRLLRGAK